MDSLSATVGIGGVNRRDDVLTVQRLLNRHARWLGAAGAPAQSGQMDPSTDRAIRAFQVSAAALLRADGMVTPISYTFKALNRLSIPGPKHRVFSPMCWAHPANGLADKDYEQAAKTLGCEVAAIHAVADTETKRSSWDDLGRPTILFERAYFRRFTRHIFDVSHHDLSGKVGRPYGPFSAQYPKLTRAATLDEDAALKSASWGKFQIMGANYAACGFKEVGSFVDAMMDSERRHLDAFVSFIKSNSGIQAALKNRNWAAFAKGYNGPGYADNDYDTKMAKAYAAASRGAK